MVHGESLQSACSSHLQCVSVFYFRSFSYPSLEHWPAHPNSIFREEKNNQSNRPERKLKQMCPVLHVNDLPKISFSNEAIIAFDADCVLLHNVMGTYEDFTTLQEVMDKIGG